MSISRFFIDRPIFASVLSIVTIVLGVVAYWNLPVAQYPDIVPPTIVVQASYPGAPPEVIADTGIYQKVPPSTWEDVVGELTNHLASGSTTEGFIRAIERCGKILAKHFPPGMANPNELPNHLIILDAYGRP